MKIIKLLACLGIVLSMVSCGPRKPKTVKVKEYKTKEKLMKKDTVMKVGGVPAVVVLWWYVIANPQKSEYYYCTSLTQIDQNELSNQKWKKTNINPFDLDFDIDLPDGGTYSVDGKSAMVEEEEEPDQVAQMDEMPTDVQTDVDSDPGDFSADNGDDGGSSGDSGGDSGGGDGGDGGGGGD
jgi:uncharacterized membrane protein YgcG